MAGPPAIRMPRGSRRGPHACPAAGGDHHPAGSVLEHGPHVARERLAKAALRFNGRSEHDHRCAHLLGGLGNGAPELAAPRSHDLSVRADPVALREGTLTVQLNAERSLLGLEVRVEW